MLLPSIRRLALADISPETLRDLVEHGEDLLVERKRQPPKPPRFGATVTSFANTLGGWVLLGVDDDKAIVGYAKPDRLDLQSHLAELLRQEADPLPPFVAEMRELDGKGIGVIRVFESADAPHIVRGTGGVYVRTSKGKQPVDDHRTLLELAKRGDAAEHDARRRLRDLPLARRTAARAAMLSTSASSCVPRLSPSRRNSGTGLSQRPAPSGARTWPTGWAEKALTRSCHRRVA
jgi:schlafen family protein